MEAGSGKEQQVLLGMWAGALVWGRCEARLAYPRSAAHKQIQHILAHLVMVFVKELVHL